jgi:hypothetical protein
MGCDGGSIPKRGDLVRSQAKTKRAEDLSDSAKAEQVSNCPMAQSALEHPNVACALGGVYNKDAVIQHLLANSDSRVQRFKHIESIKDVFELNLKFASGTGIVVCPVSLTEANGRNKFSAIRPCGCVLYDKVLEETKGAAKLCPNCAKEIEFVVALWPSEEEREERLIAVLAEKKENKLKKASKKRKKRDKDEDELKAK